MGNDYRKLTRSRENRMICGVCGGLGEYRSDYCQDHMSILRAGRMRNGRTYLFNRSCYYTGGRIKGLRIF